MVRKKGSGGNSIAGHVLQYRTTLCLATLILDARAESVRRCQNSLAKFTKIL
jgi:hypothetical protein